MEIHFANRVINSIPNLIREVGIRGASIPGFISFALGNPASEAIPVDIIEKMSKKAFENSPMKALQYGLATGMPELAEQIKTMILQEKNISMEDNDILIIAGSQQGLDITPRVLCNEGEGVFCDEFVFIGALNAMKNIGAVPIAIKMDEHGMIPEELEKKAMMGKGKYIYLIPNFHNPTGITMPYERRKEIYRIASKYNLFIYEDDPYGELIYKGEQEPSFKSIDVENRVIYAGSFSKTLAAGLRVGFIVANKEIIKKMAAVKGSVDGQTPFLNQMIVSNFLKEVDYNQHIKSIRNIYAEKYFAMINGLDEYCNKKCNYAKPGGGMFIWITMPDYVDCDAMYEDAMSKGLGIVRSSIFAADTKNKGKSFRLNFSYPTIEEIQKGVKILGSITEKHCK